MLYRGSVPVGETSADKNLKDVWRADTYFKNIVKTTVWDDAPIGVRLTPLMGDGYYLYALSEQEAKEYLCQAIVEEIEELEKTLDLLREGF